MTCTKDNPCKLLLVEDNLDQSLLIEQIVRLDGKGKYQLVKCSTVSSALNYIKQCEGTDKFFDLVLLDLNVEDSSGIDTIKAFKQYIRIIPFIVLTSFSDEKLAVEALKNGAQDYLIKGDVFGRSIMRIILYAIERHKIVSDLYQVAKDLQSQVDVLKANAPSNTRYEEALNVIREIADRVDSRVAELRPT